ncbi:hypothetical protein AB0H43_20395 [Hamadaea sp. NPDC050747]|uniref:hypothetical protein n=1 Tax=Hamadaea sp. NPDC050747 TaxID=3155789 RepID=UPI00340265E5
MTTRPLHAKILDVYSAPRAKIFAALLREPTREWRVSQLAALLPDVSVEAVRTTLYLLLGEQMMEPVPFSRSLTLRLTETGRSTIHEIRERWTQSSGSAEAGAPAALRYPSEESP